MIKEIVLYILTDKLTQLVITAFIFLKDINYYFINGLVVDYVFAF